MSEKRGRGRPPKKLADISIIVKCNPVSEDAATDILDRTREYTVIHGRINAGPDARFCQDGRYYNSREFRIR